VKKTSKRTRGSRASSAASLRSPVADVLADVARATAKLTARWYLFGAQAVILYGVPRATADVDVTVDCDAKGLVAAMLDAGFRLRVPDVEQFVARTRVLPFIHARTGLPVDTVLAGPGLEETFLDGARRVRVGRATVPVIAPEHLVVTKILAGRPKDLEDVRGLLRTPELDLDRRAVRELLTAIESALGQADLLPLYERLDHEG
jgi:hypothetical protein